MKLKSVQLGVFISTIIIGIIVLTQVYWLRKVYLLEQREFDFRIVRVIKSLYDELHLSKDPSLNLRELITHPETNVYTAAVTNWQKPDSIGDLIADRMEDFDVFTDCHVNLYDSKRKVIFFETYIHSATSVHKSSHPLPGNFIFPSYNAIILYFPNRDKFIISNIIFWIIASIILLGVLIWLGASIFYLQKQKSLNEVQRDFVNNFTHEFKTPLSIISLAAESIQKPSSKGNPDKVERYANMVAFQSRYLQNQIDRLLRYSFSEDSQLQLIQESIDMHLLIKEAIESLQPLIEEKKASVLLELNATNAILSADKDYLFIVLINLIENALKYAINPKVIIATVNKGKQLLISVKDNGEGIEKKYISKIFKKFFRVTKGDIHSAKGFGIGLSFVKKIVDSHHGEIKVESIKGIGSIFTIALHQNG